MQLDSKSVQWAIEFLDRHSDGDIFPSVPEIQAVAVQPDELIRQYSNKPLSNFKPRPCRRFMVPKHDLSSRPATQLHPQDSVLLTALIYQLGQGIEDRRLPCDSVFSYRFDPLIDHGLFGEGTRWNEFWDTAYELGRHYAYVLYCDIADFYNQIYHHTVENELDQSGFPIEARIWIVDLLKSTTASVSRGIPIGPHATHLIAECTLVPFDESLRAQGITHLRYADDILVFCSSETDAKRKLRIIEQSLDRQQRLGLQETKTKIFPWEAFRRHCSSMLEDRPINEDEERVLNIIRKYAKGNPYATITYDQIDDEDWEGFSADVVENIVREYLDREPVDYIRLRWFFRRLAQVGHFGALKPVTDHITRLEPCLGNVAAYIASIQGIPPQEWDKIGGKLIDILEDDLISSSQYARLSILSLFSKNEHIDHFERLAAKFNSGDAHVRREILLAALANRQIAWLREQKEDFSGMDVWQQMAYVYSVSGLPTDEKQHFLKSIKMGEVFENRLKDWAMKRR